MGVRGITHFFMRLRGRRGNQGGMPKSQMRGIRGVVLFPCWGCRCRGFFRSWMRETVRFLRVCDGFVCVGFLFFFFFLASLFRLR